MSSNLNLRFFIILLPYDDGPGNVVAVEDSSIVVLFAFTGSG